MDRTETIGAPEENEEQEDEGEYKSHNKRETVGAEIKALGAMPVLQQPGRLGRMRSIGW